MLAAMDVASFREKAALCLRLARGLSWNNPGRWELTDLAERFERQAKEIDLTLQASTGKLEGRTESPDRIRLVVAGRQQ
jgi:hypothetical protein